MTSHSQQKVIMLLVMQDLEVPILTGTEVLMLSKLPPGASSVHKRMVQCLKKYAYSFS